MERKINSLLIEGQNRTRSFNSMIIFTDAAWSDRWLYIELLVYSNSALHKEGAARQYKGGTGERSAARPRIEPCIIYVAPHTWRPEKTARTCVTSLV